MSVWVYHYYGFEPLLRNFSIYIFSSIGTFTIKNYVNYTSMYIIYKIVYHTF